MMSCQPYPLQSHPKIFLWLNASCTYLVTSLSYHLDFVIKLSLGCSNTAHSWQGGWCCLVGDIQEPSLSYTGGLLSVTFKLTHPAS